METPQTHEPPRPARGGAAPAARAPTPAETDALAREELRRGAQRRHVPAARRLAAFLRDPVQARQITGKGDAQTNIIDQGARVTYALAPDAVAALFERLELARREGLTAHFSERQGTPARPTSGIMLDYDLVVARPEARLLDRHAHRIACQVVRALQRDLVFPAAARAAAGGREATLHVFNIVKPAPVPRGEEEGAYKYGFHVLVPGVRVSRAYKKHLLRTLREDSAIGGVLGDLGAVGDVRECLDPNSASVPVLFFGSCKRGGAPYVPGPAFAVTFEAAFADAPPPTSDFFPMVESLRLEGRPPEELNLVAEASLCFEARYAGGRPPLVRAHECACRPGLAPQVEALASRAAGGAEQLLLAEHALSTLAVHDPEARYLHQILDLLDDSFHTERNKWRDVVYALANSSETYKPLAEWFSQKYYRWAAGSSTRAESFDALWAGAVARRGRLVNPLTRRSLIRWGRACNPERFRQVSERNYFTVLTKYVYDYGGVLEHFMVAEVLHAMLGTKFVVDIDEGRSGRYTYCWFEFVVPGQAARPGEVWKWRKEVEPDELQTYISKNLVKVFDQVADHIEERRAGAENEDQAKYYQRLGGAFLGSRRKIFNDRFKGGVVRQAHYLFRRRGFVESLDLEPLLLGVGNGVLRLGPACVLIDHFHEYPVLRFTPVSFRPFDPADPWTRLMLDAVADIVPEPDFRDWLLFFAASSLAGGVKEGLLLLWNGGGANGKTFFMRMVAKVLGRDYATKLDIGLLTAERSRPNDPNSAIMQLKGRRWGYVEETQKAEPLNSQRLKEIVNPGEISAAEKFKVQETFEITANVAVGQNYDFVIDTTDHGTWRRLRHYRSKVRFCARPDPGNPYEKKDDQRYVREYISDPDCQAAFLSILVHYYQRLQREHGGELKRVPCPTLDRETEAFRNGQDTVNRFVTEAVVRSPGNGHAYPLAAVSTRYAEWYTTNIGRRSHVASETIQDLQNSMLHRFIKRAPNRPALLVGCRLLSDDAPGLAPGETFLGVHHQPAAAPEMAAPEMAAAATAWWAAPAERGRRGGAEPLDPFLAAEASLPPRRAPARPARAARPALSDADVAEVLRAAPTGYTDADVFE